MGFLRHNLALAPRHTKEVAYKTLVHPRLEYAAPICSGQGYIAQILKRFLPNICAWQPPWSCDMDHLYKLSFLGDSTCTLVLIG